MNDQNLKATELNDEQLKNVTGGVAVAVADPAVNTCPLCGSWGVCTLSSVDANTFNFVCVSCSHEWTGQGPADVLKGLTQRAE